jgi:hypothetical protein
MHDRDLHANILGISAPWQFSDVVLDVAAGTVEVFVEHHGEASCPKCGKPCAGYDVVGEARLALHSAPRGGLDRLAERGGRVDARADPADGVRVSESRALPERDPLASRRTGSLPEAGLHPHDFLKRSFLEQDDAGRWTQARSRARSRSQTRAQTRSQRRAQTRSQRRAPRPARCVTPLRG